MKNHKYILQLSLFLGLILVMGCELKSTENNFNSELAKQLGADDYGMKKYNISFLKIKLERS